MISINYTKNIVLITATTHLADKLSAEGFNITYTEYETMGAQSGEFFDYCTTKGVYNLVNFYNMSVSNCCNDNQIMANTVYYGLKQVD